MTTTAADLVGPATLTSLLDGLGKSLAKTDEALRLAAMGLPPLEPRP